MVFLAKLVGAGLGLTSEAIHSSRDRSAAKSASTDETQTHGNNGEVTADAADQNGSTEHEINHQENNPGLDFLDRSQQDDAVWELDDMVERVQPPTYEEATYQNAVNSPSESGESEIKIERREAMIRKLVSLAGPPPQLQPQRPLPCPVIIPQRRPRKKDRGFVRAFAPVLTDCGINQGVFLELLEDFDKANQASPWIEVVFIAGAAIGCVPEPACAAVGAVLQVIAGTARELQQRTRTNTFLDRVNQEILMPRGMYAMVMAFKDQVPGQQQGVLGKVAGSLGKTIFSKDKLNLNQAAEKFSSPDTNMSKFKKGLSNIRLVSGETQGEIELPEAAALVYPDLDRAVAQAVEGQSEVEQAGMREKMKGAGAWVNDYMDRRAQTFYEAKHPGSAVVVPHDQRAPLKSRYNDPSHPANSGSMISVLTGGHVPMPGPLTMISSVQERVGVKRFIKGKSSRGQEKNEPQEPLPIRMIKKKLQEDVLYLAIVNLPSEQETRESVAHLENLMGSIPSA